MPTDAARLVIKIEDDKPPGVAPPGPAPGGGTPRPEPDDVPVPGPRPRPLPPGDPAGSMPAAGPPVAVKVVGWGPAGGIPPLDPATGVPASLADPDRGRVGVPKLLAAPREEKPAPVGYAGSMPDGTPSLLADPDRGVERVPRLLAAPREDTSRRDRGKAWRQAKTRERRLDRLEWRRNGGYAGASFRGLAGASRAGGAAAAGLARNDGRPAGAALLDGAAKGLAAIGPAGAGAAVGLKAAGEATKAFSDTVAGFVARGREISGYDARLATSAAYADVRGIYADMREADVLGEKMSRLIDLQSEADTQFRDLVTPIKDAVLWLTNSVMAEVVALLKKLNGVSDKAKDLLDDIFKALGIDAGAGGDLMDVWTKAAAGMLDPPAGVPPPAPLGVPVVID